MSPPLEKTINTWMSLVMKNSIGNFMRFAKEKNYSLPQLKTLIHLSQNVDCNISTLGDEFGVTNAAISQLMEKMVQQGLVLRTEDPQDRRHKVLVLTDEGKQIADESLVARHNWLSKLVNVLNQEEQDQVDAALRLLIEKSVLLDES
ncbi:MAG: MarR family transcriptional regulator [Anaerolineaceae bacterium]|nr:MarR family transcriptional regulator [Anaerolineaceae bacterium]